MPFAVAHRHAGFESPETSHENSYDAEVGFTTRNRFVFRTRVPLDSSLTTWRALDSIGAESRARSSGAPASSLGNPATQRARNGT
eukprot:CAMPEP_0185748958 /NCGR_PEP_ID=MMETSP1174-20130828/7693_1 /TAXON_ID=35687 /ORGANISM="Dictyocha speculum, Strain CCMP1381" /LENGTH=84 /DNA_ID=CAMNT_0028424875 /DNA_START=85 /DNA_END=336 /DNA_ORIENTATION=+